MKNYEVKALLYHESFNGYEHCDGWNKYYIIAKNEKSALNKVQKLVQKNSPGHWIRNSSVIEILDGKSSN